jgi:hypothetical protein
MSYTHVFQQDLIRPTMKILQNLTIKGFDFTINISVLLSL